MDRRKANEEPGISNSIVGPVLRALVDAGFDAGRFARLSSDSSAATVAGSSADRLFDAAAAQLDDDAVGLTVARKLPIGALGPLDYATTSSRRSTDTQLTPTRCSIACGAWCSSSWTRERRISPLPRRACT